MISFLKNQQEEKRLVTGVVLQPNIDDTDGDFFDAEVIEKAAHDYLAYYGHSDLEHIAPIDESYVHLVESYIAPQDLTFGEESVPKGSWIITLRVVNDALWQAIKDGDFTGFSAAGFGYVDVNIVE
jgi:hypothetical protein